jgi:phytoene desaturase
MFVLVPIAPGLQDTPEIRAEFTERVLTTMERVMDIPDLRARLLVQKTFAVNDFSAMFNSFKGTALGLAHTLGQTAIFRPNTVSKKVKNLYYVGANTNPGIGMPVCLVSAELVYKRLIGDRSHGPLRQL